MWLINIEMKYDFPQVTIYSTQNRTCIFFTSLKRTLYILKFDGYKLR